MEVPAILQIRDLQIDFRVTGGMLRVIDQVDFDLASNLITAVIGESGSGKSTLGNTVLGLYPANSIITPASKVLFQGKNLLEMSPEELRQYRWRKASMVFQSAQSSMNPTLRIGEQLTDSVLDHEEGASRADCLKKAASLLELVHLDAPRVLPSYPHEISGGMKQRVMIAMALALDPELIILDEPTTALDVLTQQYIFDILADIHQKRRLTMMLITHDIELAARIADVVVIMYGGEILERIPAANLFARQGHPYTEGLLNSIPRISHTGVDIRPISGHPPDLRRKPGGCIFHPRCGIAIDICKTQRPPLVSLSKDWCAACHLASRRFGT
jgi:peptide/nickel transport system ATP-binding protein